MALPITAAIMTTAEKRGGLRLDGDLQAASGLALFDRERRNVETGQAWSAQVEVTIR